MRWFLRKVEDHHFELSEQSSKKMFPFASESSDLNQLLAEVREYIRQRKFWEQVDHNHIRNMMKEGGLL